MGKSSGDAKRRRSSADENESPSKAFPAEAKRRKTDRESDKEAEKTLRRSLSPELSPLSRKSKKEEKKDKKKKEKKKEKKDKSLQEVEKSDKKEKKKKDKKRRKSEGRESGKGSAEAKNLSIRTSSPKARSSMSFGEMMRAQAKRGIAEGSNSASSSASSSGATDAANWSPKNHPFLTPTAGPLPFLGAAAPLPFLSEMPDKKATSMKAKKGKEGKGQDSWEESWKQSSNSKGSSIEDTNSTKGSNPEKKQRSGSTGSARGGKNGASSSSSSSTNSNLKITLLDRDSAQYCLADKANAEVIRVDEESDANSADPNAWKWTKEEVITVNFEGFSIDSKTSGLKLFDGDVKSFQKGKLAFKLGVKEVRRDLK